MYVHADRQAPCTSLFKIMDTFLHIVKGLACMCKQLLCFIEQHPKQYDT